MSKFSSGELIALFAISGGFLITFTAIIGGFWHETRKAELMASLKHDMLSQGMSAEDIKTVLEAGVRTPRHARNCRESCHV
jgi:hypothetical protein